MPIQNRIEQDSAPRKRGRPRAKKVEQPEQPEQPETCTVLVMHKTNIQLSVGKKVFRDRAEIPVEEYEAISAGDAAAGRPQRLERIG